jgi:phosphatidylserine decarboxylase
MKPTKYYDRKSQSWKDLRIARQERVRWLYSRPLGKLVNRLSSSPFFSKVYGWVADQRWSTRFIASFVEEFEIEMSEFTEGPYSSFNSFFSRPFRKGRRTFSENSGLIDCPAEAYLRRIVIDNTALAIVKGHALSLKDLLESSVNWDFGESLILRLSPQEYHRFHFPADGRIEGITKHKGPLYSVNPLTLQYDPLVLFRNMRSTLHLDLGPLGKALLVVIGATYVGSLVIHGKAGDSFRRGEEAGFFKLGGSTLIFVGERDKWRLASDLLTPDLHDQEAFVRLGESISHI